MVDNSNALSTSATWEKETNFNATSLQSSNWSFDSTNDWLLAGTNGAGLYLVNYHLSLTLSTTGTTVLPEVTVFVNEVEQSNLINKRNLPKQESDDVGSISGTGIITISNGSDNLTLRLRDPDDKGPDLIVKYANVNIFRLGDVPTAVPVELISFCANYREKKIILTWSTATEVNNYGFEVQRLQNNESVRLQDWETIGFIEGHGNSNSTKEYTYRDVSKLSGTVKYRLKQIDIDGSFKYSDIIKVVAESPTKFILAQNHPNPFNPTTKINFSIPKQSKVSIHVFNSLGQEMAELVNKDFSAGNHSVDFNATNFNSGIYFYTLQSANFTKTMKMILLK